MIQYKKQVGFTLIELMLAMAFVGALLVAIAVTTIHIMGTYTKGLTVREVNQAGRTISEDIQRTIAASAPFDVSGANPMYITRDGGGRLCSGAYTYAWNYGTTIELGGTTSTHAYNIYTDSSEAIRLVKVSDTGGALCLDAGQQINQAQAKELLQVSDRNLAVQDFTVSEGARDEASRQAIYAITLILGTSNRDNFAVLNASNSACLPPKLSESSSETQASDNEKFCAINKFNIIARAGNRSGSL